MAQTDLQFTELSIESIEEKVAVVQFESWGLQTKRTAAVIEICDCRQKGHQEWMQTPESKRDLTDIIYCL